MNRFLPYHPPSPIIEVSLDQEELNQIAMDWGEYDLILPVPTVSPCSSSIQTHSTQPKIRVIDVTKTTEQMYPIIDPTNGEYERRKRTYEKSFTYK